MRIVIVGAGIIGVTTAYVLRRAGHEVTVLERREAAGLETSFANGGLLTPSAADPWNAPGVARALLQSIGRSDAPLQFHFSELPSMLWWGVAFLRNSSPERFVSNTLSNFRLAQYSRQVMESLREHTGIGYGRAAAGTLSLFRDVPSLENALLKMHLLSNEGLKYQRLSVNEAVALEPALAPSARILSGAIYHPDDETGNAFRFCDRLAHCAIQQGVIFEFGAKVTGLQIHGGRITGVSCGSYSFAADRYVIAAGSYSAQLLKSLGIRLPLRPAKGYSLTFAKPPPEAALRTPIIDHHLHAVMVPLDGGIRVAGTAEFAGYDLSMPPARIANLLRLARDILPQANFDLLDATPWCGLRPMSSDGVPIIGPTSIENLLVNTGHGHLGWTLAAGSAQVIADYIDANQSSIDSSPYRLSRF